MLPPSNGASCFEVPLEDPRSDIRLLTLLPPRTNLSKIECTLHSVALGNAGSYEALSYHWWGPVQNHILLNGTAISVRENLYQALSHLRNVNKPRVLWIDALCIDQAQNEKDAEKSHQLHLMSRIYRQAQRTVAWFGREATGHGGTHTLERFMRQLLQHKEEWSAKLGTAIYCLNQDERCQYGIPDNDHVGWKTLTHLLTRSWVNRIWVIQEVAVARRSIIQCGPYQFSFEDVAMAYTLMWNLSIKEAGQMSSCFKSTWAECTKHRKGQQRTLLSLVIRHQLSKASLPHDKIYALCGLASDSGPGGLDIKFDYTKSVDEVYTDFARDVLRTYQNLDILSALAPFHEDRSQHLPSWVPDWRVFRNGTLILRRPDPLPEPGPCLILFMTTKGSASKPVFSADGRLLQLHGYMLDTIEEVGGIRPHSYSGVEMTAFLLEWRNKIARCTRKKCYAPTGQSMLDVFYHTMTMADLSRFLANPLQQYRKFDSDLLVMAKAVKKGGLAEAEYLHSRGISWTTFLHTEVMSACRPGVSRRLVRTKKGYLGLVHGQAEAGDQIGLFRGGSQPLVVRKTEGGGVWRVVGDGYVHGVMMGEAWDDSKCKPFWFA